MRGPTLAFGVFLLFNACSVIQAYSSESAQCDAGATSGCTANQGDAGLGQDAGSGSGSGSGSGCTANQGDAGFGQDTGSGGCSSNSGYGYTGTSSDDAYYGGQAIDATYVVGDDCGADHAMDADAAERDAGRDSSVDATWRDAADGEAGEASLEASEASAEDGGATDGGGE